MSIETIDAATHTAWRARIDAFEVWRNGRTSWHVDEVPAELRDVDNNMRGKVEQYELLRDMPERFVAYIGKANRNGMGVDRIVGQSFPVTTWNGEPLGFATRGDGWRVRPRCERVASVARLRRTAVCRMRDLRRVERDQV